MEFIITGLPVVWSVYYMMGKYPDNSLYITGAPLFNMAELK